MKPPFRGSSNTKIAALNVKKLAIKKKNNSRSPSNSSAEVAAKAITRARNRLPASRSASKPSTRKRQAPAQIFWIRISNVHENVAYEDIVRAIFQRCVHLRSKGATPSTLGAHFQDSIAVAFATKEDAKDAVNRFQNRIKLFHENWRIVHCKPKRLSDAAFPSSLGISNVQKAPEFSDDGLAKVKQSIKDGAGGNDNSAKVAITSIDDRVPIEVVLPLFRIAGRVRSHKCLKNSDGSFKGTVEYERRKDAVAAAKLFRDNINFFGRTWYVKCDHDGHHDSNDDDDDGSGGGDDNDDSSGHGDDGSGGGDDDEDDNDHESNDDEGDDADDEKDGDDDDDEEDNDDESNDDDDGESNKDAEDDNDESNKDAEDNNDVDIEG